MNGYAIVVLLYVGTTEYKLRWPLAMRY